MEDKSPSQEWKNLEKSLVKGLVDFGIIPEQFTGQLTFHFNVGGLCDIDKLERGLTKKFKK